MIRAFKEEDTETVIRIWLAASVRSHSFIDKAYWEEKAESMRTLYLPLSEIVVDEDRATGEKDARHIGSFRLCGKRTGSRLLPKKRVPYNR